MIAVDTNILVYAQQSGARGARARELVAEGGVVNVQVLNELANVLRKKLKRDWPEVFDVLADVRDALDPPLPLPGRLRRSRGGRGKRPPDRRSATGTRPRRRR